MKMNRTVTITRVRREVRLTGGEGPPIEVCPNCGFHLSQHAIEPPAEPAKLKPKAKLKP